MGMLSQNTRKFTPFYRSPYLKSIDGDENGVGRTLGATRINPLNELLFELIER
jgi:hypothetical protein